MNQPLSAKVRGRKRTARLAAVRHLFLSRDPYCWYCGRKVNAASSTLDHFLPQSAGGSDAVENLRLCCLPCNIVKADNVPESLVCGLTRGQGVFLRKELDMSVATQSKVVGFNYACLDDRDRKPIEEHTLAIRRLLERATTALIEIGRHIQLVHKRIGTGNLFQAWCRGAFGWDSSTAMGYARMAEKFGGLECADQFEPGALAALTPPKVPDAVCDALIGEARAGKKITAKRAKEAIGRYLRREADVVTPLGRDALVQLRHRLRTASERVEEMIPALTGPDCDELLGLMDGLAERLRRARPALPARPPAPIYTRCGTTSPNRARVVIGRKQIALGAYGSPESLTKYRKVVEAAGFEPPAIATLLATINACADADEVKDRRRNGHPIALSAPRERIDAAVGVGV